MRRQGALLVTLVVLCGPLAGCATLGRGRIPQMHNAKIEPDMLNLGDTAVITIEVADRLAIVTRVEGEVVEEQGLEGAEKRGRRIRFKLGDDGQPPDAAAGDGIWSLRVDVPFQAPPGDYTLKFIGYDLQGEVVLVPDQNGNDVPLSATFTVTILYPEK